ncbi:MAG: L,D-transpeptidase family protein, partial [Thermoanaerobaculia bacterium]|nr:L,D-transpeptidase family protein [Thermoanaerobaculia bacterium]
MTAQGAADVQDELRRRLEHGPARPLRPAGEPVYASTALPAFYEQRVFAPAWSREGRPTARATELVAVLEAVGGDGLDPAHYHVAEIRDLARRGAGDAAALADLDLLASDAFLILAAHLVSGRVDPVTFDGEWIAVRREVDLGLALGRAVDSEGPRAVLAELHPDHAAYARLRAAAAALRSRARAGGWATLPPGDALRPGERGDRVEVLRARLEESPGSLEAPAGRDFYDPALEEAVRAFQARHGLTADAVVGAKTLEALNVPADERVRQIELNLERWRWLPQDLGRRHVLVNVPAFTVALIEDDRTRLEMRAAVGRNYRRTPVFSDSIRYLVLNPFWEVPHRLAVQDKLPEIRKDPTYLSRQGFSVYRGWGADEVEVDPATVDWQALSADRFPFRLRQSPGPLNALG